MSSFEGMDVEEVERLAARLDLQAKAIASVVGVVDAAVAGLAGIWIGDDLDAFRALWHQTHRPKAVAMGGQLDVWVTALRHQAAQQRVASGEASERGEVLGGIVSVLNGVTRAWTPLSIAKDFFGRRLRVRDQLGRWVSVKRLNQLERELQSMDPKNFLKEGGIWRVVRGADKVLGPLGIVLNLADLADAKATGDEVRETEDVIGVGGALLPFPLSLAVSGAEVFYNAVLPSSQPDIDGAFNFTMKSEFGSSYDPAHPTFEQTSWVRERYSGPFGVVNWVSDGIDYKREGYFAKLDRTGDALRTWVGGL